MLKDILLLVLVQSFGQTTKGSSFMMGARWYVDEHIFFRLRGLIGANDVSVGVGYLKPIDKNFRLEGLR